MDVPSVLPKCGNDPRDLPDFSTLRDMLDQSEQAEDKAAHWMQAETLCRAVLSRNGTDLQTLAWLTIARFHCDGICGMNDGLGRINNLFTGSCATFWPVRNDDRGTILSAMCASLIAGLKSITPDNRALPSLHRAADLMKTLCRVLDMHQICQQRLPEKLYMQLCAMTAHCGHDDCSPAETPVPPPAAITPSPSPSPVVLLSPEPPRVSPPVISQVILPETTSETAEVAEVNAGPAAAVSAGLPDTAPAVTGEPAEAPPADTPAPRRLSFFHGLITGMLLAALCFVTGYLFLS